MNALPLVRTERVVLRPWRAGDGRRLGPILEVNYAHLAPWIPSRIASPAAPEDLEKRIQKFADDFAQAKEWRYAMFTAGEAQLLGEISLFPRSAETRVPYAESDRIEIGYWIRGDMTGKGFVTEAVRAIIDVISLDRRFRCAEIRCDERNAPSGAIPSRLGFTLTETVADDDVALQIWTLSFVSA